MELSRVRDEDEAKVGVDGEPDKAVDDAEERGGRVPTRPPEDRAAFFNRWTSFTK